MTKLTTTTSESLPRDTLVSLMTVFGMTQQLIKDRMRSEQVDGLGPLHLRLLCLCGERPGCTQQQLADLIGRDKGQVAHLIKTMEVRGLVTRAADPADARLLRMNVTPEGAAEILRFMAIETDLAQQLFSELPVGDIKRLHDLAARLLSRAGAPSVRTP